MKAFPLFLAATLVLFVPESGYSALKKWNVRMQELQALMNELLPELSRSDTPDPKALAEKAQKLSTLVHSLGMQPGKESLLPPDADPTLTLVQSNFARETKRAHRAIIEGYVEYGKSLLRATTGYCIACHTRNASGPEFPTLAFQPALEALTPLEKARLLAATRQFDGALDAFTALAADESFAQNRPLEWSRSVSQGLALAIRVREDPDRALKVLDSAAKVNSVQFVKRDIEHWRTSLAEWKKEKGAKLRTEDQLSRKAQRLLDRARKLQEFPVDRSADVLYWRATALLHEQLRIAPQGKLAARALYSLGKSYEVLDDLAGDRLHELFYETCIRQSPHTPIARSCYAAYESAIYFGYSGSSGLKLPEDVREILNELSQLANAAKTGP